MVTIEVLEYILPVLEARFVFASDYKVRSYLDVFPQAGELIKQYQ